MTVAAAGNGGGALDRGPGTNLADVVSTILDKGIVIDAQVQIGVVGINLVEINARVVVASVETYLRFAEAVDRLDITPKNQQGLPEIVEGVTGSATKGLGGLGKGAKEIAGTVKDVVDHVGGGEAERQRAPRRREERE